ncbi:hypothetical protein MSM1_08420 [Mycobacterium sp. SM1]|uniref:hypothetical protein n=1 Tax=Mycobacterium sp. SM1 TaxID=2816243 RepID=UPI001BCFB13C|nr:hypothetical protein [Mycobacterium sp. SM1]MBS4728362.1 hypothetical protein [Mycobacterium sp. SM1]
MSQLPFPPPAQPPGAPSPWPPVAPPAPRRPSPWLTRILLITALAVIGAIAIGAWFRPLPNNKPTPASPGPTFTDQQVSNAKASASAGFEKVRTSIPLQTSADSGGEPVMTQAVAASARLALLAGGYYLQTRLDPATPPSLATAIRSFSNISLDLAENALSNVR